MALRIVAFYIVGAGLWVAFSDYLVARLVPDPVGLSWFQTLKGLLFVAITGALLYFLVKWNVVRVQRKSDELAAIIDSIADGVIVLDPDLKVIDANQALHQMLGLGGRARLGSMADFSMRFNLRYLDGRPVPLEEYASYRALRGETVQAYDAIVSREDGTELYVGISAAPIVLKNPKKPAMAVVVLRDMSELRRLESLRDEFLATAAHELKTPVTVIKTYAQLLERQIVPQGQARQHFAEPAGDARGMVNTWRGFEAINRQCDKINRLIQDLLEVTRLRLPKIEMERQRFELGALIEEVLQRMREIAPRRAFALELPGKIMVHADRERIERVLVNLIDNAMKFSPEFERVAIRVSTEGSKAQVAVVDHGIGIPEKNQGRIAERYYKAHVGTPYDYGGMGVGLSISREIVLRHGGRFWFESAEGKGSTFSFTLALAEGEPK